jgi:hypothetical protein
MTSEEMMRAMVRSCDETPINAAFLPYTISRVMYNMMIITTKSTHC